MVNEIGHRNRLIEYSLYIGCILSNLSQMPYFVKAGMTQNIAFPGWILVLISILITGKIRINHLLKNVAAGAVVFFAWIAALTVITSNSYFSSSMTYSFVIAIFMLCLGFWSGEYIDKRILNNIFICYIVSIVVVSISIFIQYFGWNFRFTSRIYAYSSKNSVSQMIFTAIIILIISYKPTKRLFKYLRIAAIAFEFYVILLLRSRATLVSFLICIVLILLSKNLKKGIKIAISLVGIGIAVFLVFSESAYDIALNYIVLAGRSTSNLDDLTSGRLSILSKFPNLISGHWIDGIGARYYESFPLSAVLQFGVIGGVILIWISLLPLLKSIKYRSISKEWELLFLLSVGFCIDGLFEGLTPFGPGIKCYFLWLLFGIVFSSPNLSEADVKELGH